MQAFARIALCARPAGVATMAERPAPFWRSNVSLLLTALAALALTADPDPEPPARKFTATFRKPQDVFSASVEKSVPVWKIDSKSGIGDATVTLAAGAAPKKIVIRFARLRNLATFHVEAGDLKLSGAA